MRCRRLRRSGTETLLRRLQYRLRRREQPREETGRGVRRSPHGLSACFPSRRVIRAGADVVSVQGMATKVWPALGSAFTTRQPGCCDVPQFAVRVAVHVAFCECERRTLRVRAAESAALPIVTRPKAPRPSGRPGCRVPSRYGVSALRASILGATLGAHAESVPETPSRRARRSRMNALVA